MGEPRVFISSTFVDLKSARAQIRAWLETVFDVPLLVMESFGSETAPPDVNSVRRMREAELFIGIYGFRYGQIEPTSGKSITELELDEAERMHSAGVLRAIFLYKADENAAWLKEHAETDASKRQLQDKLRLRIASHTYTSFSKQSELVLSVVRDIYRVIKGTDAQTPSIRRIGIPQPQRLKQPVGMEFLKSADREYLLGREELLSELRHRLEEDSFLLLLGESGVGKTSLVHAALIPEMSERGGRVIYTRPLGFPCTDVMHQVYGSVFEGQPPFLRSLMAILGAIVSAVDERPIVLVIDQFEDILAARDVAEAERLIGELSGIRREPIENLRVLISYRSDMEGRLGKYWQSISGSPLGLPRVYVAGLDPDKAWRGMLDELSDLHVRVHLTSSDEDEIKNQLIASSMSAGVRGIYPPYLQMLIDHIWHSGADSGTTYSIEAYRALEGMDGVIGGYLSRVLSYANDASGNVRRVLATLVKSYGVKAQKTIAEIAGESNLGESQSEEALEKLIDLRLVRHLNDQYEIAHDFIARKVASELLDSEEREYKRFRELLATRAAAYQTTQNALSTEELLMLFKRRKALVPSEAEGRLLTRSWLDGVGPGLMWLMFAGKTKFLSWIEAEAESESSDTDQRAVSLMLAGAFFKHPIWHLVGTRVLRRYRRVIETVAALKLSPELVPEKVLRTALAIPTEAKTIASEIICSRLTAGDWRWISVLRNSKSRGHDELFMRVAVDERVPMPPSAETAAEMREFAALKTLTRTKAANAQNHRNIRSSLGKNLATAITAVRSGTYSRKLKTMLTRGNFHLVPAFTATSPLVAGEKTLRELVDLYRTFLPPHYGRDRVVRLSEIIRRICLSRKRPSFKTLAPLLKAKLLNSEIFSAAIAVAAEPNEVLALLSLVRDAEEELSFASAAQLARQMEAAASRFGSSLPRVLADEIALREFWGYIPYRERGRPENAGQILSLKNQQNRPLYIRLLGHFVIGASAERDLPLLARLARHYFDSIAKSAILKMHDLVGEKVLDMLSDNIDVAIRTRGGKAAAETLRFAEMVVLGFIPPSVRDVFTAQLD